jgi:type IV pilus assembly protein PilN
VQISLNLASHPYTDFGPAIKRLRIAMGVLVLVALGLLLGLRAFHQKAEEARAREHSLDGQIARIALERQGYQNLMRQPENAQLLAHTVALNQLFGEKAFSWTLAMEDLETVLPGGVQVTQLEPVRGKDGTITLHLRVVGPRDRAVDLVKNLEHSRRFLLPRIVGESAESTGGAGEKLEPVSASNRVNFDVLADYNTSAPIEHRAQKKQKAEQATGKPNPEGPSLPARQAFPVRGMPMPVAPGQPPVRRPYTGPVGPNPNAAAKPGGAR